MANNLGVNSYTVGGDYDTWGDKFVEDMSILNKLAGDTHVVADTSGTVTLDVEDCQNYSFQATGSGASQVDIRVPDDISRAWYVRNDRASGAITVRCAAGGTAVTIAATERRMVYSDGDNCVDLTLLSMSIAAVSGLQAALDAKAALANPALTGNPTAPTPSPGDNDTSIATTAFVKAAIDVILGGVSGSYDTLGEIAAALTPVLALITQASAGNPGALAFFEQTTNGTNKITLSAPASLASDRAIALPDAAGTVPLINASGALDISGGSQGQIAFPATQNPSSDPNTLDDYEEGTWTPTLTFGGGSVGITYAAGSAGQTGIYTKIGNLVFASYSITLTSKGSSSGVAQLNGLPFTAGNQTGPGSGMVKDYNNLQSLTGALCMDVRISTTVAQIKQAGAAGMNQIDNTNFSNSSAIFGMVIYHI